MKTKISQKGKKDYIKNIAFHARRLPFGDPSPHPPARQAASKTSVTC